VEYLPLPSFDALENTAAWLAVFEAVNLYDAELRAVRLNVDASQSAELDLYLPGEFAIRVPAERRASEYCATIRCIEVSLVRAEGLGRQAIVGDYAFDSRSAHDRGLRVRGALGGDLEIRCGRLAVARVTPCVPAA
jgi:hypothetical protein